MQIFSLLSLSSAILALTLGLLVYFKSNRNWLSFIFMLFGLSLSFLNFSQFEMRIASDFNDALVWSKMFGIWSLVLALSVHFTYELIRTKKKNAFFYLLLYLPGVFLFYAQLATNYFSMPPVEKEWGWAIQYNYGLFHNLAAGYGIVYWLLSIYFVSKNYIQAKGIRLKAARLIFIGYTINFIITVTTDFLFPIFKINFPELGGSADLFTLVLLAYAVWKYQMFSIDKESLGGKLFQSISNYLILTDNNGYVLEVNQNLLSKLGYSSTEIIGKRIFSFIDKDKFEQNNPFYQYKTKNTEFKSKEIFLKNKLDESVLIKFSASFINYEGSSKPGILYVGENESKETQKLLKDNRQQTEFLAEAALDMIHLKTKEEVYEYASEKLYNLLEKEAIVVNVEFKGNNKKNSWKLKSLIGIGSKLRDLINLLGFDPSKMAGSTKMEKYSSMEEGKLTLLEFDFDNLTNGLISNKKGEIVKRFFGIDKLYTMYIKQGNKIFGTTAIVTKETTPPLNKELIESFVSIASMVLNRQFAEAELAKSEKLFRTIVENSQVAIFIIDLKGKFILAEGQKLHRIGMRQGSIIGKSIFELYADLPDMLVHVKRALKGEIFKEVISLKGILHYHVSFSPFIDEDGQVNGIVCMADDITNRIRSEKKLEDLTEMQSKIFRVMGHDLNSPIANIISYSNLLLSDFDSFTLKEIQKFTATIQNSAENSYQILGNIIEWSKTISKETPIQQELVCLHNKVLTAIDQVLPLANKKSIKIMDNIDSSLSIMADRNMIITILRNLLSNSIKFTPPEGQIKLEAKQDEKNIYLKITDNGIGMLPEQVENLFVYKANKTSRGTEGEIGSGLGLQITKDFMNKNGAEISVKSKLNEGSVFTLVFPRPKDIEKKVVMLNPN